MYGDLWSFPPLNAYYTILYEKRLIFSLMYTFSTIFDWCVSSIRYVEYKFIKL